MTATDLNKLRIDRGSPAADGLKPRRSRVKIAIAAAILLCAAALIWTYLAAPMEVETATVAAAYPSQNDTVLYATGYVVPQRKAALASKAQGRLEWLGVLEGSRVEAGQVVARLESADVRAALDQAIAQVSVAQANLGQGQAELRDAEANLRRSQELLHKRFIAGAQHDANIARFNKARAALAGYEAAVTAAQANRRAAEVAVDQTLIRAPFDGIVLTKNANVGDNITPFSSAADSKGAVITIADMSTLEVEADVSESSIAKIRVDQPCEIQLDALPDVRLAGVVSRMVPTVDRAKATVLVKVRFVERDPRVLPDMSGKVAFLSRPVPREDNKPVTAVQPAAIVERDGKQVVFQIRDGRVYPVAVTTGRKIGEVTEIAGLKPGERVVLNPNSKLRDGTPVTVAR